MNEPVAFLIATGQALANMGLYGAGHPSRERALRSAHEALTRLMAVRPRPTFSFLDGEAVFEQRVLAELREWEWSGRLAAIGVERVEFVEPVDYAEFHEVLTTLYEHLSAAAGEPLHARQPESGIRFGRVTLAGEFPGDAAGRLPSTSVPFDLGEEVAAVRWVHEQAAGSGRLPGVEIETIIRSLSLALRHDGQVVLSLLELASLDEYAVTHSYNTAVLTMGLAEYLGYAVREVRLLGVAALLHDLGNTRLPPDLLSVPGPLGDEARRVMQTHPVEGARLILDRHPRMELAAVVAYEHHLDLDGGGYPALLWPREPHFASRLVRVCDVYDAAIHARPWRSAHAPEEALRILGEGAGRQFDPDLVRAFTAMIRQARVRHMSPEDPVTEAEGLRAEG